MTGWDDTDCQTPVCTAGICELQCEPLGVEAAAQSSQPDCKTTVCDGACGYQDNADDSDVHDDGVDCTQDFCDLGTVSHPPEPLNTPCGASGLCDGNGACGACNLDTDCQSDTFCRDWSCNTAVMPHVCVSADINQGVDLPAGQSDGDCHTVRCNNGLPDDQVDDTDLPVDNEQCTFDECNAGTPTNPPLDIDEPCTQGANGRFCDGSGACVNCNDVTQCSLADGICDNDACNANNCEVEFHSTATNAPASCQSVTPDCQVVKCDGAGECGASVPDDVDVVDDGNECTADSCSGGMEVHDGAPVEGNLCTQNGVFCDGDETCQSGTCSTDTVNPVCPGHNVGPNCNDSCNEGMADCTADDLIDTSCGDPTNDACTAPDTCDGMGTCLGNHAGSGDPCGDQGVECLVDDACDGNGACTDNGAEMAGTSCGDGTDDECTNPDSCDGAGTCLDNHETSGAPCGTQGVECFLNDACDGSGSCTDNGFAMSGSACGDNADTECTDPDTCDGGGTCLDNHAGSGDPCGDQGADCHVDDACDGSGACTDNGFAMIDTSCGDATDDACTDPDTCDATGTCLDNHAASGAPCGDQGVDCHVDDTCNGSGMCTDNGFEMMGTACGDLSDTECTNPDTCDNGGVCLDNHEPATTACGDGVTEPTCDPDHCDAAGGCTDEPDAANGTTCTENGGDVCFTSSCVDARVVFVTSTLYDGDDLGSALDADTECTTRAGAAGLAGSYMAWMSDSTTDPDTRFTQAAVEYLLLDGTRVANNWTDLSNGNLDNAINVDEFGAAVGVAAVWTGTVDDGTASSSYCLDWQSVDNLEEGVVGSTDTSSSGWSDGSTATCDQSLRIFCVEQ